MKTLSHYMSDCTEDQKIIARSVINLYHTGHDLHDPFDLPINKAITAFERCLSHGEDLFNPEVKVLLKWLKAKMLEKSYYVITLTVERFRFQSNLIDPVETRSDWYWDTTLKYTFYIFESYQNIVDFITTEYGYEPLSGDDDGFVNANSEFADTRVVIRIHPHTVYTDIKDVPKLKLNN